MHKNKSFRCVIKVIRTLADKYKKADSQRLKQTLLDTFTSLGNRYSDSQEYIWHLHKLQRNR